MPVAQPEQVGLNPASVAAFLAFERKAGTYGLTIFKDGKRIAGFGETNVRMIYSVTKAVTSMAVGRLVTEGKWSDLDAPIGNYLSELKDDPKGVVTIRQLMSHTSGIRDARDENGHVLKEWNTARDWLAAAIAQPMENTPGLVFKYNNQGPVLIGAAVERTTGERLDKFVARTIFAPLCITDYRWLTDHAGHAGAYTGLSLSALDLAKLGQLMLDRGSWHGARILSPEWVSESAFHASQTVNPKIGLIWFLQQDAGRPLPTIVSHSGDGGQYILLFPNQGIVVSRVRSVDEVPGDNFPQRSADHLIRAKVAAALPAPH
jgi:CubicO group peptidase (beta-lactamase class C family)